MAWTVTRTQGVMGNKRVVMLDLTADTATQAVETGLSVVEGFTIGYQSCATGPNFCYANSNASGVQSFGVLGLSGFTSGDELFVLCYGR